MKSPSPTPVRARRSSTTLGVRKTVVSPSLFLGLVALVAGSFATYRGVKLAQRASFWDDSTERRELKSELEGSVSAASLLQSVQLNAQFRTILLDPRKQIEARIEAEKSSLSQKRSLNKDDQSSRGSETSSGSNAPGLDTAGVDQRNEKRSGKKGTEKKSRRDWKVNEKSKRDLETEAETEETSGLRVRVIENGLKGSLHEEAGFVRWRDSVILLGSFNVSRDQAPIIVATQSSSSAIGSTRVTNFNLTTGAVTTGPDLPVLMHHPAAAISPGGVIHVVGSADWSDMSSSNDDAFQFTWDVEGGGTEWVARARYLGAAGGFSCEFLGELMYCCGGGRRLQERTGNLVRVYSPANDSWSEAAPLPEVRRLLRYVRLSRSNRKGSPTLGLKSVCEIEIEECA